MPEKRAHSAGCLWPTVIGEIMSRGRECAPRGLKIKELLSYRTCIDMRRPVVNINERVLGRHFLCAEAAWILSGDNRVATIREYSPTIAKFSDDDVYFFGAYGPKIVDQLTYVIDTLVADPDSRQAVINIWREKPRQSKDVPCTLSVQWFIRDGLLHCVDTMRSSDAWLGLVYDWFNFSMLSGVVLLMLRERFEKLRRTSGVAMLNWELLKDIKLGTLFLNAGSEHLYEPQWEAASAIAKSSTPWDYDEFNPLKDFRSAGHLISHLWRLANRDMGLGTATWLVPQCCEETKK